MKIALCQTAILWEKKEENLKKAETWIAKAKKDGAELICFPEMSFTGFSMHTERTAERRKETVRVVSRMAEEAGLAVGFGWVEQGEQKARNHYTVVGRRGELLVDYVKLHPFSYSGEDLRFEAGQRLCLCRVGELRIGIFICYDLRFPEPFQALADRSDLLLVAANWPKGRREHWKCLLRARAIECQAYVAGVNCCGEQEGLAYSGDSCIFAPDGRQMAGFQAGEGLLTAEIPGDADLFRKEFPVRQDRRRELYRLWYQ